jgi:hypothetical protein
MRIRFCKLELNAKVNEVAAVHPPLLAHKKAFATAFEFYSKDRFPSNTG